MLKAEMDTHPSYGKHGVSAKMTLTAPMAKRRPCNEYGEQEISVPRDRLGEFEPR